ncbi:MAG: 30S ribosomal protein S2 [Bacilli bacterium]|jgi:small subunit ribosomal protein S2
MSDEKKVEEKVVEEQVTMDQVLPSNQLPVVTMKKLLTAGAHFGHQTRLWNPRMKPYIYGERNGVHIINLEKTIEAFEEAYDKLKDIVTRGGKVLFVGTRKSHADFVREQAERCGSFYINYRWLGGTLTNFRTIQGRIRYLRELEMKEADGGFEELSKKDLSKVRKEMDRLTLYFSGIKEMRRVPEALVITSPLYEMNAVKEAKKLGIPVFGLIDTNSDPRLADYGIPANDDASKTVNLFLQLMADAVAEAKGGMTIVAYTPDDEEEPETLEDSLNKQGEIEDKDEELEEESRPRKVKTKHSDKPKVHGTAKKEEKVEAEEVEQEVKASEEKVEEKEVAKKTTKKATKAEPKEEKPKKTTTKKVVKETETKEKAEVKKEEVLETTEKEGE